MNKLASVLAISLLMTMNAQADIWAEREALAKVVSEINAIEHLVHDASKLSENRSRVKFNYDALMNDLEIIKTGINTHLSQPIDPVMPSSVNALGGSYTTNNQP